MELLIARATPHDGDPTAAARGCPHPLTDGHQSSLSICSLETDVLRVSCITVFFLTVKSTSSFCPPLEGKGFLQMPQSNISTNLHGSLLHRYALSTQNTVWLKNSLPDICAFWFEYVAGIFSFIIIIILEAVLMKWEQNQIAVCQMGKNKCKT